MNTFIETLLDRHQAWSHLTVLDRAGDNWRGIAIVVPQPSESDLAGPLDIEQTDGEVTISLDYSHIHMAWPPRADRTADNVWTDAMILIDAILREEIVASSSRIDGQLRAGSLTEVGKPTRHFLKPHLIRVRSWRGTYDRDEKTAQASR